MVLVVWKKDSLQVSMTGVPLPIRAWLCVCCWMGFLCGVQRVSVVWEAGNSCRRWELKGGVGSTCSPAVSLSESAGLSLTCTCARHRHAHTPDSWRSSTSERCSDTSLCASQSGCCGRGRSTAGRSPRCRVMTRCRLCRASRTSQSPGWAHKSWASPRSRPGHAQWGAWRRRTWLAASPPSLETHGASPPPSLRRCRTCPSGSHPACGSRAAPTSTSSPRSFQTGRDTCSAGACGRGWSEKHTRHIYCMLTL